MTVDGLKTIRASLRVVSSVIVFGLTFFVLLSQNGWAQLDRIERERALYGAPMASPTTLGR